MEKSITLLFALVVAVVSVAQQLASVEAAGSSKHGSVFSWTETTHDFGKIKAGVEVSYNFTFSNTGDDVLLITSVVPSCGCTITDYSKDPIPSGGKGYVKATYRAAKPGVFSKTVTVHANTAEGKVILTVKGEVTE
ncbi:MAG: DUF1573 domain-containing protein [Cyclobacteriaceae bacterium]|nr:DUF1573 domain-containing protein [Cyclobacteriaceae bacterium]